MKPENACKKITKAIIIGPDRAPRMIIMGVVFPFVNKVDIKRKIIPPSTPITINNPIDNVMVTRALPITSLMVLPKLFLNVLNPKTITSTDDSLLANILLYE